MRNKYLKLKNSATRIINILFISLISCTICAANPLRTISKRFTVEDGLGNNTISEIYQDHKGYIWFATWNGISRFDGYVFHNYNGIGYENSSLSNSRIQGIKEDSLNNLWLTTYNNKVYRFNRKKDIIENPIPNELKYEYKDWAFYGSNVYILNEDSSIYFIHTDKENNTKISLLHKSDSLKINSLHVDNKGHLWGITDYGLLLFTIDKTKTPNYNTFFHSNKVSAIGEMNDRLYIGIEGKKNYLAIMDLSKLKITDSIQTKDIITEIIGKNNTIYILENKHTLYKYQNKELKRIHEGKGINGLYIDSKDLLWFFTNENGVSQYNPVTKQVNAYHSNINISDYYAKANSITEVNSVIWVNMNKGGLEYYDSSKNIFYPFPAEENIPENSNIVHTKKILEEGVLWLSFYNRGLYRYDIISEKVKHHLLDSCKTKIEENEVRALYYDKKQNLLYVGNIAGKILVYNSNQKLVKQWTTNEKGRPFGQIYDIYRDKEKRLWISTKGQGLYCIYENEKKSRIIHFMHDSNNPYSISSNNVYSTICDDKGRVWIATYGGGVNLISENNGELIFLSNRNVFKSYPSSTFEKVRSLAIGADNKIWAGTSDGIIILDYDEKKSEFSCCQPVCSITDKNKQFNNDIIQILKDEKQRIWVATMSGGLNLFENINKDGIYQFKSFGKSEGLPSNDLKSITYDSTGKLWIASDYNLCSFDPDKGIASPFLPQDGIDGTMCSENCAAVLEPNHVVFGTISGIYEIDYRRKKQNIQMDKLKLSITDFYLEGQLSSPRTDKKFQSYVPEDTIVKIPTRTSTFGFRFAVLNYKLQQRTKYQYRIIKTNKRKNDGENEWINADKSRIAFFSDIPAGTYYFEVKAFLLEYPDQYELKRIKIEVPPYIFLSSKAFIYYSILLLAIIAAICFWNKWQKKKIIGKMRIVKIGPQEIAIRDKEDYEFVTKQLNYLEENYSNPDLKIQDMADFMGMSRTSYYIRIKSLLQITPIDLLLDFRLKKAMMYLEKDNCTVSEVAFRTGFNEPTYFSKIFKQKTGITPTKYRIQKTSLNEENSNISQT